MAKKHFVDGVLVDMPADMEKQLADEAAVWNSEKNDRAYELLRQKRDILLTETDWASLPDSTTMSDAMKNYRQSLRDFPASTGDPYNVTWPTKPS